MVVVVSRSPRFFEIWGGGPNILEYTSYRGVALANGSLMVFSVLSKLNLNSGFGVSLMGLGWIMMCFLGDRASLCAMTGFIGEGDFIDIPSVSPSRFLFVGAGVTGDCNLLARKLGGMSAGVCFSTAILGGGEGRLSKTR